MSAIQVTGRESMAYESMAASPLTAWLCIFPALFALRMQNVLVELLTVS